MRSSSGHDLQAEWSCRANAAGYACITSMHDGSRQLGDLDSPGDRVFRDVRTLFRQEVEGVRAMSPLSDSATTTALARDPDGDGLFRRRRLWSASARGTRQRPRIPPTLPRASVPTASMRRARANSAIWKRCTTTWTPAATSASRRMSASATTATPREPDESRRPDCLDQPRSASRYPTDSANDVEDREDEIEGDEDAEWHDDRRDRRPARPRGGARPPAGRSLQARRRAARHRGRHARDVGHHAPALLPAVAETRIDRIQRLVDALGEERLRENDEDLSAGVRSQDSWAQGPGDRETREDVLLSAWPRF